MHHTMLPSKFNSLIDSGILQQGSIIHLKKWTCAILCQCMYASFFIILTYVFVSSPFSKIIIYVFSYLFFPLRRSILLHEFDVIEPSTSLIGHPIAISCPPSLETTSLCSSMQEPPQKKQCTLLQSASPSTIETTILINALSPYTSNWSIKGHV